MVTERVQTLLSSVLFVWPFSIRLHLTLYVEIQLYTSMRQVLLQLTLPLLTMVQPITVRLSTPFCLASMVILVPLHSIVRMLDLMQLQLWFRIIKRLFKVVLILQLVMQRLQWSIQRGLMQYVRPSRPT